MMLMQKILFFLTNLYHVYKTLLHYPLMHNNLLQTPQKIENITFILYLNFPWGGWRSFSNTSIFQKCLILVRFYQISPISLKKLHIFSFKFEMNFSTFDLLGGATDVGIEILVFCRFFSHWFATFPLYPHKKRW